MSGIHWIDGKGCLRAGGGTNSPTGAFLIWDVQGHVTPPSTQAQLSETLTVASVSEAVPCSLLSNSFNVGALKWFVLLDLVYKSESRKSYLGGVVVG